MGTNKSINEMKWKKIPLKKLAKVTAGTSAPQDKKYFENGAYPFVRTQDVGKYGRTTCLNDTKDKVNEIAIREKRLKFAKVGSIIFPKSGASILTNNRAILGINAYIVSHLAIVDSNIAKIDNKFLYYYFCTIDMAAITQTNEGYPSLRLSDLNELLIPLPPKEEQRRIVSRIEELTSRVEQARRLREKAIGELDYLLSATIKRVVEEEACEEKEPIPIRNIVLETNNWNKRKNPRESFEYIEISGIDNKSGLIKKTRSVLGSKAPSRAQRVVHFNDVIFATTRPYLKNIAVVPAELDNQIASSGFCVLRANPNKLLPSWLYFLTRSDFFINQIVVNQEKNAYPSVTNNEVLDAKIPIPPIKKQKKIIEYLENIRGKEEQLKQNQTEIKNELSKFTPALLAKAFRGEL